MPIIVGSPRSGTTLLRFMLDTHPELAIPPETGFLNLFPKLKGRGDKLRQRFFHEVVNFPKPIPNWPDFEISEETFWAILKEINPFNIPDGYRAFYQLYATRFGKARWGDKTPLYCMELNLIRRVLPEARFIHIIRDGRDAALSLRKMWFSPGWEIGVQAAYWKKCVLAARQAGLGRTDYMEVHYEDLILKPQETLERICGHISLRYDEVMLRYYTRTPTRLREHKERSRPNGHLLVTRDQRRCQQVRTTGPPDSDRVLAWKQAMDVDEIKAFQIVAGDLLKKLGYEV